MSAHTPGPWQQLRDQNGWIRIGHGHNCSVASVFEPPIGSQEANARLISAAPELLEACQLLLEWTDREEDLAVSFAERMRMCENTMTKCREAIAKAVQA